MSHPVLLPTCCGTHVALVSTVVLTGETAANVPKAHCEKRPVGVKVGA